MLVVRDFVLSNVGTSLPVREYEGVCTPCLFLLLLQVLLSGHAAPVFCYLGHQKAQSTEWEMGGGGIRKNLIGQAYLHAWRGQFLNLLTNVA